MTEDARLNWYRNAIAADPQKRDRFALALERARSTPGTSDTMESLDRMMYDEPSLPPLAVTVRTPPRKEDRSCRCSEVDEYGRPVFIGWCGPDCEGRGENRR